MIDTEDLKLTLADISSLICISKGSSKSRHDVRAMLKRSGATDFDFLNDQAIKLGVKNILEELRADIDSDEIS